MEDLELRNEIMPIASQSETLVVSTPEQYELGANILRAIKDAQKKVIAYFEPIKSNAHRAWRGICDKEGELLNPLKAAESKIKTKMLLFRQEQERIRQEQERRLQAEADERARRERERLEKEAAKLKTPELREQRMAEAESVEPPVVYVQSNVPKVAGISTRDYWKVVVEDKLAFVKASIADPNIMNFIVIDTKALDKFAQATKGQLTYPGIRIYKEQRLAAGVDYE